MDREQDGIVRHRSQSRMIVADHRWTAGVRAGAAQRRR
jgi:hypothetical protein